MITRRTASPTLLAALGLVAIIAMELLLVGLDMGRVATQALQPTGAVSAPQPASPLCHG